MPKLPDALSLPNATVPLRGLSVAHGIAHGAHSPERGRAAVALLLLLHGTRDGVCHPRNSLALASRVCAAGGAARAVPSPGTGRVGIVVGFVPSLARRPTRRDIERFVGGFLSWPFAAAIQPAA